MRQPVPAIGAPLPPACASENKKRTRSGGAMPGPEAGTGDRQQQQPEQGKDEEE